MSHHLANKANAGLKPLSSMVPRFPIVVTDDICILRILILLGDVVPLISVGLLSLSKVFVSLLRLVLQLFPRPPVLLDFCC